VRAERLAEMREKLANYKRFRELTDEWVVCLAKTKSAFEINNIKKGT
jgi:hypothetical protein